MSEQGNTAVNTEAADDLNVQIEKLKEKFNKREKLFVSANDDQEAFVGLVTLMGDNIKDWTVGADENAFKALGLAKSDNGRVALIPIATEEAVFADPVVRRALYKLYVSKVLNAAQDDEAQASHFLTVSGNFKQKFDVEGFNGIAKAFVKFLKKSGLSGVNKNSLRQSFASQAFAQTQFPRTTPEQWGQLLSMAKALAAKNELDTSIFDHWEATRAVQTADTSVLNIDFAKFGMEEDEEDDTNDETETAQTN